MTISYYLLKCINALSFQQKILFLYFLLFIIFQLSLYLYLFHFICSQIVTFPEWGRNLKSAIFQEKQKTEISFYRAQSKVQISKFNYSVKKTARGLIFFNMTCDLQHFEKCICRNRGVTWVTRCTIMKQNKYQLKHLKNK